jgi:hypothetical protein
MVGAAEKTLLAFPEQAADNIINVVETMHDISEGYLKQSDFKNAKYWCQRAIRARKRIFGAENVYYYLSLRLLAQICKAEGDDIEADGCEALLPRNPEFSGIPLFCAVQI